MVEYKERGFMAHGWNQERAAEQIGKRLEDVKEVVIKEYVRDMNRLSRMRRVGSKHASS
jgi:hypothetical protein